MRTILSGIWKRRPYFRLLIPVLLLFICLFGLAADPLSTSANTLHINITKRGSTTPIVPTPTTSGDPIVPTVPPTNSTDPTPVPIPTGTDITPPTSTDINPDPFPSTGDITPDPSSSNPYDVPTTTAVPTPTETAPVSPTPTPIIHPTPTQTAQKPSRPCPSPTNTPIATPKGTPTVGPEPTVTATPTTPSTPTGTDASGQAMPSGDLPGWHQIFSEDFNTNVPLGGFPGNTYNKKFSLYPDATRDTAGQHGAPSRYYPSKVVSVNDGLLNLHLHSENGTPMAAAILPTLPGKHLYGKYTIRFRSDALPGFKTAWLLWPDSGAWPHDGEIDFPEGDLSGNISAFVHHQDAKSDSDQDAYNTDITFTSWHTASIEWTPNKVVFILDSKVIGTSTNRVPNTPMHWVIQTESCSDGCPAASTEGNLQIAWVVAYSQVS